jgi:hypothetical protein
MKASITITARQTRVLVQDETGDRMLAQLPPLSPTTHPRALPTLLEALALWCGQVVPVVLSVDELFDWQRSGLSDALDFGTETLFYSVEIVPLERQRRRGLRPKRLRGLGSFAGERSAGRRIG